MPNASEIVQQRYGSSNELNTYKYFNPYRIKENVEPFMGGLPIIFMTTPSMNIFNSSGKVFDTLTAGNQLFSLMEEIDPYILKQLQYSGGGSTSTFIKLATNRFKGITLKDFTLETVNEYENYYGWQQILPKTTVQNYTAESSLNVNFSETKNLDITKLFYSWICYMEATRYGLHEPSEDARVNRILDFTSSLYFFLLDFDMRTILYWCKYTGIFPTNVPLGNLIMSDITSRGPIDTSITFAYQYKEELNPQVLFDFNVLSDYSESLFDYSNSNDANNGSKFDISTYGDFSGYDPNKDKIVSTTNDGSSPSLLTDDGRDFLYNKEYDKVSIRTMVENNYVTESQTPFNSEENNSKKTFVMEFSSVGSSATENISKAREYTADKYNTIGDNIRKKLLSSAVDIMGEFSIGLIGNASMSQYNEYLEERKKALQIDDESLDVIKESYKRQLDDGSITQEKYDAMLESLQTTVDKKMKDDIMDYNTYKSSEEYKNSVRMANYMKIVEQNTKLGKLTPSITDYYQQLKNDNYKNASAAVDAYLEKFGRFESGKFNGQI